MDINKFRQVNAALAARYSLQTLIIVVMAIIILMQQWFINTREEIVIDRPMFQNEHAMKLVRGKATQDIREAWAFNLVNMYGNFTPESLGYIRGVTYSMIDNAIMYELDNRHKEQATLMAENQLDIRFVLGKEIVYEADGWVTIRGTRIIKNLVNPDAKDRKIPYMYSVKIDVDGFRPWVTGWKEGEIEDRVAAQ